MMSFFGVQYGFLFPWLFGLGCALGTLALVYAYLRKGRAKKIVVSSVMFLKSLQNAPRARQKFIPPFRFFFEMLLLFLLLAGGAGLYSKATNKINVLIDNSAGMEAKDNSSDGSKSLFEEAKEQARLLVSQQPWGSQINVFLTSPSLISLTDGYVGSSSASNKIASAQSAYAADNLETSVQKIRREHEGEKIVVVTDKRQLNSIVENSGANLIEWKNVKAVHKETAFPNVAIGAVSYHEAGLSGEAKTLEVNIQSYSKEPVELKLKVEYCNEGQNCKNLSLLDERTLTVEALKNQTQAFQNIPAKSTAFYIQIEERKKSGHLSQNTLLSDDSAWITKETSRAKTILVSDFSSKDLGLQSIPTLEVTHVQPQNYQNFINSISPGEYKSIIFHRFVPSQMPKERSIFIAPPASNQLFKVIEENSDVEVARWSTGHPLLSYVNIANMRFKVLETLQTPDWAEDVISTPAGSAAFAGIYQEKRFLIFGFEILPYEGKRSPALSILTLNALKWISEISSEVGYVSANSAVLPKSEISSISYLSGENIYSKSSGETKENIVVPSKPGLLDYRYQSGIDSFQAVRFVSPDESDTLKQQDVQIANIGKTVSDKQEGQESKTKLLAIFALLLLMSDLIYLFVSALNRGRRTLNAN